MKIFGGNLNLAPNKKLNRVPSTNKFKSEKAANFITETTRPSIKPVKSQHATVGLKKLPNKIHSHQTSRQVPN